MNDTYKYEEKPELKHSGHVNQFFFISKIRVLIIYGVLLVPDNSKTLFDFILICFRYKIYYFKGLCTCFVN